MIPKLRAALLVSLLAGVLWHGYDLSRPGLLDRSDRLKFPDFVQFYTYGLLAREGPPESLYDTHAHSDAARRADPRLSLQGLLPNYSPIVAYAMSPFTRLPFLDAATAWSVVSLLCYLAALVVLTRTTHVVRRDPLTLALAALAWPALFVLLRYGQISAVSLLLAAAAALAYSRGHGVAAGLLLGSLIYKPNLLVGPAIVLAVAAEWWMLFGVIAAAGCQLTVAWLLAGPRAMAAYLGMLIRIALNPDLVQTFPAESHSVRGLVRLVAPSLDAVLPLVSLAAVGFAVWAAVCVWRRHRDPRPRMSALILAALVASPHVLTYDLILLAVPIVLTVDWQLEESGSVRGAWLAAVVLLYAGAWPGTLLARIFTVQISTVGMLLALWQLAQSSSLRTATAGVSAGLLEQPHHQLVGAEAQHRVVDRAAARPAVPHGGHRKHRARECPGQQRICRTPPAGEHASERENAVAGSHSLALSRGKHSAVRVGRASALHGAGLQPCSATVWGRASALHVRPSAERQG